MGIAKIVRDGTRVALPSRIVTGSEQSAATQSTNVEGRYANGIQVGHNAFEFVLDFSQQYGGAQDPPPHTRIVTSPHYARGFLETLQAAVDAYEREFGAIETQPSSGGSGGAQGN